MKILKHAFALLIMVNFSLYGQGSKTFSFKKGEILDVILLTGSPTFKTSFEKYKKSAFPVAFEYSYKPQRGFRTKELLLGNYLPSTFTIGKWDNKAKREAFIENIPTRVPDLHKQRRDTFTYFALIYYEMEEDLEVSFEQSYYHVATSLWSGNKKEFEIFISKYLKEIKDSGGEIKFKLKNGSSVIGYTYNPDLVLITSWKDEKSYKSFAKKYPMEAFNNLKNVHQFVIQ